MLHQSIEKIQYQLSMSQIRNKNKTLEDLDNPEKIKIRKSMKTSFMMSVDNQQPSFKISSFGNSLKFSSQIYTISIKHTIKGDDLHKKIQ